MMFIIVRNKPNLCYGPMFFKFATLNGCKINYTSHNFNHINNIISESEYSRIVHSNLERDIRKKLNEQVLITNRFRCFS